MFAAALRGLDEAWATIMRGYRPHAYRGFERLAFRVPMAPYAEEVPALRATALPLLAFVAKRWKGAISWRLGQELMMFVFISICVWMVRNVATPILPSAATELTEHVVPALVLGAWAVLGHALFWTAQDLRVAFQPVSPDFIPSVHRWLAEHQGQAPQSCAVLVQWVEALGEWRNLEWAFYVGLRVHLQQAQEFHSALPARGAFA